MRKLATIRRIDALTPIDGADAIECATVGGWKVVVKKGEYTVGDLAVYCEIDSWIPTELAAPMRRSAQWINVASAGAERKPASSAETFIPGKSEAHQAQQEHDHKQRQTHRAGVADLQF